MIQDLIAKSNLTIKGNLNSLKTIVFLHGFGTTQHAWKNVTPAFEEDYKVVLYDNIGSSDANVDIFDFTKYSTLLGYTQDLLDIFEEEGITNAIVVGHSVSGMIALLAAIKAPDLFSKLIVLGASPHYLNSEDYKGGFSKEDLNGIYDTMDTNYQGWASGFASAMMGKQETPDAVNEFATSLCKLRPDVAQSVVRTIFQSDYRTLLPRITVPVLILQSAEDNAVPMAVAEYLHRHVKNNVYQVLSTSGHFPHITAPAIVVTAIKNYLNR